MLVLSGVLSQQGGEGGIVRNELAVIPTLPQECSQRLHAVRYGPVLDDGGVFWKDAEPLSADFMSQVLDMVLEQTELSLGRFGVQPHGRLPIPSGGSLDGPTRPRSELRCHPGSRGLPRRRGDGGPLQPAENR